MIVVGLTGGIASGKSTVAAILESAGAVIIDADEIARAVVKKGLPAWHKIVKYFGRHILLASGEINRSLLGDIVFNDLKKREALNRIVHPYVKKETVNRLQQIEENTPQAVVIIDVPLLFETGMLEGVSEVIVVYAPEHTQLERLIKRGNLSEADALARIRSQMPIEEKKKLANIVIDNSGPLESTRKLTLNVYRHLKRRAKQMTTSHQ